MDTCYKCGAHETLEKLWAFDDDCWDQEPGGNFVTHERTSRKHFCRTCRNTFNACRFCGDVAAAYWEEDDGYNTDICANPARNCWPVHWEQEYASRGFTARNQILQPLQVDSFVDESTWPGEGSGIVADDDAAPSASASDDAGDDAGACCYKCDTQLDAHDAFTYHGDDNAYCPACVKAWLVGRDDV